MGGTESKPTLVEIAYEKIRDKICDFELYPGQDVSDFTLCKELGMSRTPVRQALVQLEHDGLVKNAGIGKSYQVSEITEEEIADIFEAREAIEVSSLRLAMMRGLSEDEIKCLERINLNMEQQNEAGNIKLQFRYDQGFHNYLVSLSGNKRMGRFYETLVVQLNRMRVLSYLESSYQKKAYNDHRAVLEEIRKGDREEAVKALAHHLQTSKRDYCNLIQNRISLDAYGILRLLMRENTGA